MGNPTALYSIGSIDAFVFGDGKPFTNVPGAGNRDSLDVPFPSTLSAAFSSQLVKSKNRDLHMRGPLLSVNGEAHFPIPADAMAVHSNDGHGGEGQILRRLAPNGINSGSCLPHGLESCGLVGQETVRPVKNSCKNYLNWEETVNWIAKAEGAHPVSGSEITIPEEMRFGITIDPETESVQEGQLYSQSARRYGDNGCGTHLALLAQLEMKGANAEADPFPDSLQLQFGAERGAAIASRVRVRENPFLMPDRVMEGLMRGSKRVRMTLATPAFFNQGWLPEWLAHEKGSMNDPVPEAGVKFKLVAACVRRRVCVNSWASGGGHGGPLPTAWCVPAGSVYFLEAVAIKKTPPGGSVSEWTTDFSVQDLKSRLERAWMRPVSDQPGFRRRGFGLAMWGLA